MQSIRQDIVYTFRLARQNPGTTLAAFLALTLGIGSTTAIFSVVNGVLLRATAVVDADRIARIFSTDSRSDEEPISMTDYVDWRAQVRSFSHTALYGIGQGNITGDGPPQRVIVGSAEDSLLPLLGVSPFRGRGFDSQQNRPGQATAAWISWSLWQTRFGGQNVLGRKILLDGKALTIGAILPKDFIALGHVDVWIPITFDLSKQENKRGYHWYMALGRIRDGASLADVNRELKAVASSLAAQYPRENKGVGMKAFLLSDSVPGSLRPALTRNVRPALIILFCAVGCVLLIACGNVANLALARASARTQEIAVRIAVGARRMRLFRQVLTESVLLSISAAIAGLALAWAGVKIFRTLAGTPIPDPEQIALDWRVFWFALATGVAAGVGFGIFPALSASFVKLSDTLKQSGYRTTDSKRRERLKQLFVAAETAIATLLLIASSLLIQSFIKAISIDINLRSDHLFTAHISLPASRYNYEHPGTVGPFVTNVLRRVRALPGITDAAFTSDLPLTATGGGAGILVEGRVRAKNAWEPPYVQWTLISPRYFKTMGIPLLQGREFTDTDRMNSRSVAVVNQRLAREFFPGEAVIGRRLAVFSNEPEWREIVGIAADVPQLGLEKKLLPEVFFPLNQLEAPWLALVARTEGNPLRYTGAIRNEVQKVDPSVALFLPKTMDEIVDSQFAWRTVQTWIIAVFAAIAVFLSALGIHAVIAYSVAQRTAEIGVRMAIGAQPEDIIRHVVWRGMTPALAGIVVGVFGAFLTARFIATLLFGVEPIEPKTYASAVILLLVVAAAACYFPARRAASIEPLNALHYE